MRVSAEEELEWRARETRVIEDTHQRKQVVLRGFKHLLQSSGFWIGRLDTDETEPDELPGGPPTSDMLPCVTETEVGATGVDVSRTTPSGFSPVHFIARSPLCLA